MPIPEFILKTLFVKGSFLRTDRGCSFQLCNKFLQINITSIELKVDGENIPGENIFIGLTGDGLRSANFVQKEHPLQLDVGVEIAIEIITTRNPIRNIMIAADTKEVGRIQFSINVAPSSLMERIQSHNFIRRTEDQLNKDRAVQPIDWEKLRKNYSNWFSNELDRPLLILQTWGQQFNEVISCNATKMALKTSLSSQNDQLLSMHYYQDAYPKYWPNFGPGVLAGILGSQQVLAEDKDTAWFRPAANRPLALLGKALSTNYQTLLSVTKLAVEKWRSKLVVSYTDLGGNLDILASLMGTENLLFALTDSPQEIECASTKITKLWISCFRQLTSLILPSLDCTCCWGALLFPGDGYYLQSDFSYMISPKMFERFVLPDLDSCCHAMQFPFYHLDGTGQLKHLDMLLSIPELKGIQWVPGEGQPAAAEWLDLLSRIRKSGKLVQVGTTYEGALKIVKALGKIGFCFEIEEYTTAEQYENFMGAISQY